MLPEPMHDWNQRCLSLTTIGALSPRTAFHRLRNSTQSQLERARRTTVQKQYTHTYIPSIRITVGDDYDRGCTKNTFTALRTKDQQHVLACGTIPLTEQ